MDGYFIRRGDKTSCGGEVTGADDLITWGGIQHAREGDSVTCGVTGKTYQILGGVSYIKSSDRPVAGTLNSVSGCPCRATLYHSYTHATYEPEHRPLTSSPARSGFAPTRRPAGSPPRSTEPMRANLTPAPPQEECSGAFRLLDQQRRPCGFHTYTLFQNGEQIGQHQLNDEGFSHIGTSSKPAIVFIATNAPSPVLE
ncbi:PAAR domain-containing protein [Pseudomonas sp. 148P]|uniref:PAAR domain-containing protein n=1 Tax=Pseudomonas ulcerans TaxID=3115852 RepID=A0ABU7HUK6_9PSED|nr:MULTISPECIES: PAAR domain-containing protein [unclassified Pseudomonas]MEE1923954.1 PAAR domain-containing protein [Pseudomonas sp. 147P]MEE1935131.1 PAAR domain-containing protein [Pseudomonas sp. 148P]